MPEDRRLVAIMFTDIVGYTALMGRDEDKAFQILRKNREIQKPIVKKYRGEWLKEMGDGILASFRTASDAVRCAGDIQNAAKEAGIPLRIGIHEGEVVFEDNDVLGDGVNIASRLEELAEEGCINISGTVYKDIKNKAGITAVFVEEKNLKNVDEPIKIYSITCEEHSQDKSIQRTIDSSIPDNKSIIVLPFVDISPDQDNEYFSDGLTEEIITDLSHIHDLLVISRSSAMTFKGTKSTVREIAEKVNVRYVLEGSVRKVGNNLRITAQLIDGLKDIHLWAEKYSGTLDDVFDIQEKVARTIADSLKLKLTPQENDKLTTHPIDKIAAYECYLRARLEIHRYTEESLEKARQLLQNGIEIIGESEILYAGMALIYISYYEFGIKADENTLQKAKEFLDKVSKLNPESNQYFYLLGRIERFGGNAIKSLRYCQKALSIKPNDPEALFFVNHQLIVFAGKYNLAEPHVKHLMEIDPLTPMNYFSPMMFYVMKGEMDLAIDAMRRAMLLNPNDRWLKFFAARYLSWNNQLDEAFEIIDQIVEENSQNVGVVLSLFSKYALLGKKDDALQVLTKESINYYWNDPDVPWFMADYYSLINEKEEALKWLEHNINHGMINYPLLNEMDPFLENIRGEDRFKKLMARIKTEWENFEL